MMAGCTFPLKYIQQYDQLKNNKEPMKNGCYIEMITFVKIKTWLFLKSGFKKKPNKHRKLSK